MLVSAIGMTKGKKEKIWSVQCKFKPGNNGFNKDVIMVNGTAAIGLQFMLTFMVWIQD